MDFQSLFDAVKSSESPDQLSARRSHSSTSTVSITEVKSTYVGSTSSDFNYLFLLGDIQNTPYFLLYMTKCQPQVSCSRLTLRSLN